MDDFLTVLFISVAVLTLFALVFAAMSGLLMLCEIPERSMFNEKFGTEYGAIEWLFAEGTIKDYIHQGEQKLLNIKAVE